MNINDVRTSAIYYKRNFLESYYFMSTLNGKSYLLVGEKMNFAHLIGIPQSVYTSHGYPKAERLYNAIISGASIDNHVIPTNIVGGSKMERKLRNFTKSADTIMKNSGPVTINYNASLSAARLDHVDILITDIAQGFMIGWVFNKNVEISPSIKIKKYCPSSWIDESSSGGNKLKYMPNQDIELLKEIYKFDNNSKLVKYRKYRYSKADKILILNACSSKNGNLLIDKRNERHYVKVANDNGIHCKINGIQYN